MALSTGTRLGPYEILTTLGAGGMGEVYKARDTRLDRTVAIKILTGSLAANPQFRERFEREARTISQLDHPHICTVHDVGEDHGTSFLVMQYLEGKTLADRIAKGPLPLPEALPIAIQISDALQKAHRAGIVHRDVKPANIFLTKSGAKLLDFGLAKTSVVEVSGAGPTVTMSPNLTGEGTILGTIQYMAPEQIEGHEADARTDIFAFGTVLHEMLTGNKAFQGTSQATLISSILRDEPRPVSEVRPLTPPLLDHIVSRCLAKDPDERWQNASDLTRELRWLYEGGATAGQAGSSVPPRIRRSHLLLGVGGALLAGISVGVAATLLGWFGGRAVEPAPAVDTRPREHRSSRIPASDARGSDHRRGTSESHRDGLVAGRTVDRVHRGEGRSATALRPRP